MLCYSLFRTAILSLFSLLLALSCYADGMIYGPAEVSPGDVSVYQVEFGSPVPQSSVISWSVSGGRIISEVGMQSYEITVQWDEKEGWGAITASEDVGGGYTGLSVTIGQPVSPLNGGNIRTTSYIFNAAVSPALISYTPAANGSCATYTYYWEASVAGRPWMLIHSGEDFPATPFPFTDITQIRRRVVNCAGEEAYSNVLSFYYQPADQEREISYVKTIDVWKKGVSSWPQADMLPIGKRLQSNSYLDGLGRPIQTLIKQGSLRADATDPDDPASWIDQVTHIEWDEENRTAIKYLSYAAGDIIGKYKPAAKAEQAAQLQSKYHDAPAYSRVEFENNPSGRVAKTFQPGSTGAAFPVESVYGSNTLAENIRIWNVGEAVEDVPATTGTYKDGALFKNTVKNEYGKETIEYKDKDGRLVLKKIQDKEEGNGLDRNGHAGWICTYYIYDDYGNLRCVIQPKGVAWLDKNGWDRLPEIIDQLCFRYGYDERNRMVLKKNPGSAAVYIIYDRWDRLVLTQDGNQRTENRWICNKYDEWNRPVSTAFYIDPVHTDLGSMIQDCRYNENAVSRFEERDGSALGYTSTHTYPVQPAPEYLTVTYYDDYGYPGAKAFSSDFTIDNNVPADERMEVIKSDMVLGQVTGMRSSVLDGGSSFLLASSYYDARGRLIQTLKDNYPSGQDITTTQYDFAGKVRSAYTKHAVATSAGASSVNVLTKWTYDFAGNLVSIIKKINDGAEKKIVRNAYDELGHLKEKRLAPGYAQTGKHELEKLLYDYNIRGWMTGMNKQYVGDPAADEAYFGMEIGYDQPGTAGFASRQLNGNIAGIAWKSRGDNIPRKYDFQYDNLDRLKTAGFSQQDEGAGPANAWSNGHVNFNVTLTDEAGNSNYDENGNIKGLKQWGLKAGRSMQIDDMRYSYKNGEWSNRLLAVTETPSIGSINHGLGDFTDNNTTPDDYDYDPNGNLQTDKNKRISLIAYNHLNLPALITVEGKGTIEYVYDASGNKLQKTVREAGKEPKQTSYTNGFVYEDGKLQYFSHEQGRVRAKQDGNNPPQFLFDYFITDHLGNVRMVLTEERNQLFYPAATLETSTDAAAPTKVLDEEKRFYSINDEQITANEHLPGPGIPAAEEYANNNAPVANGNPYANALADKSKKMYKLNGASEATRTGLGITLRVMSGDVVNIFARSYYFVNGSGIAGQPQEVPVSSLVAGLLGTPSAAPLSKGVASSDILSNASIVTALASFLADPSRKQEDLQPKAAINWILFDEQLNIAAKGLQPIAGTDADNGRLKSYGPGEIPGIEIIKNGYLYIYCSNESPVDVFFDNLQLVHTPGPILEETHYYPFGLTMEGISSRAVGGIGNRKEFNGIEHITDLDLNQYDAFYRTLDPQIGRFLQIDPKIESAEGWSPYSAMLDNPIRNADPLGDSTIPGGGFWRNAWEGLKDGGQSTMNFVKSLGTSKGWENLGNGLGDFLSRGNFSSPETLAKNAITAYNIVKGVKNVPNMTKDELGHAVGYGTEKVVEAVVLSKGTGAVSKLIIGEQSLPILPMTSPIIVNESTISAALEGSTMKTTQSAISIPVVERYVRMLESGTSAPSIKVAEGVIVDGNHRYVAGRVFRQEPTLSAGTLSPSSKSLIQPIQNLKLDPLDWKNR